jgi:hypothetical protein
MTQNMERLIKNLVLGASLTFLLAVCPSVKAISITISPDSQAALAGTSTTFSGTIENPGTGTIYLNSDSVSLPPSDITVDATLFLFNAPLSLGPGGMWTGPFFQLTIGSGAGADTYNGTFTVYGGASSSSEDIIGTSSFEQIVERPAAVPEFSSTLVLLLIALIAIGVFIVPQGLRKGIVRH